jgi:predicted transcriptional regulator
MILNFEIDDELGALLDDLAKREQRSRRGQAIKIIRDALEMLSSDNLDEEGATA